MASPGMISKSVPIVVAASLLLSCQDGPNSPNNDLNPGWEPVVAVFPDIGTILTEFTFTAFAILDSDTVSTDGGYQARWDFDHDGVYDTDWQDSLTAKHTFDGLGKHVVQVALRDSASLEHDTTSRAYVLQLNQITRNESRYSAQGNLDWSRDGTNRIAFDWRGLEGGEHQIWMVAYPGGDPVQLTFDQEPDSYNWHQFPEWSPDGKKIVSSSDKGIASLDLASGDESVLIDGNFSYPLNCSPDGRWLMFAGNQLNQIDIYDFENRSYEEFVSSFGDLRFCFSPNGDRVAISNGYEDATLSIIDFATRNLIKEYSLPYCGSRLDWSPDGHWISLGFAHAPSTTLFILHYESGHIYTAQFGGYRMLWYPSWSADGSLLAFEAKEIDGGRYSEIWTITFPQDLE